MPPLGRQPPAPPGSPSDPPREGQRRRNDLLSQNAPPISISDDSPHCLRLRGPGLATGDGNGVDPRQANLVWESVCFPPNDVD